MMIVMKPTAHRGGDPGRHRPRSSPCGARAHASRGEELTVIGAIGDREHVARLDLEGAPGVEQVVPILKPYKLASRSSSTGERTVIEIDGRQIGGEHFSLIAGPCTVESRDQTAHDRRGRARTPARSMLRGGAYKPRTSPYAFQGLGQRGPAAARRGQGGDRPADRHRADGRARPRAGARGRRRDPGRRPQHAELPAAGRDRPRRQARCCSSAACRRRSRSC